MAIPALSATATVSVDQASIVEVETISPLTATFSAVGAGGTPPYTYAWDFDDGSTGTGASVSHTFAPGTYAVMLTTTDSLGATTRTTVPLLIGSAVPPTMAVTLTAKPSSGKAPLSVVVTAAVSGGVSPYVYAWSVDGKGSGQKGPTLSWTFQGAKTHVVAVTVTDSAKDTAKASVDIVVS